MIHLVYNIEILTVQKYMRNNGFSHCFSILVFNALVIGSTVIVQITRIPVPRLCCYEFVQGIEQKLDEQISGNVWYYSTNGS